jgi:GTP cyclohydrolase I/GTP cyclohydrolase-4
VEDCVREAIRMAVAEYESIGPDAFVLSRQENLETIHQHNVMAERYGLIGELASELDGGEHVLRHVTMRDWLDGVGV